MESSLKQLSRDLEVLGVQDTALVQRLQDLEQQDRQQVMDPAHLAKLEKQVSEFEKNWKKAADTAGEVKGEVNR